MKVKTDYICALTNLYGHVLPEKVCKVYNQHQNKALNSSDFEIFLNDPNRMIENRYVYIKDGEFIEETLYLFEEKFKELCAKQVGKPHYVPNKKDLKQFVNLNEWEKPLEYEELESYILTSLFPEHEVRGLNLADEIFHHIMEDNFDDSLQTLIHFEVAIEEKKALDPLLNIMQRLNNNTRMRAHNAFTPIEISNIMGESLYILPDKILEDDNDCHCGSKKKYNECHKKDDDNIRRLSEYRSGIKEI